MGDGVSEGAGAGYRGGIYNKCGSDDGKSYSADKTFVTTSNMAAGDIANATPVFTVSPNPAHGSLHENGLTSGRSYTADIYDISGRKVSEGTIAADGSLHIEQLRSGTYFIRISSTDARVQPFMSRIILD